jgi:small neutral amino acid transporter SnatA (MarC family)
MKVCYMLCCVGVGVVVCCFVFSVFLVFGVFGFWIFVEFQISKMSFEIR